MSTNVTYVANVYAVPAYQDTGYAQGAGNLSSYLIALATGSLTLSGGTFTLTADANFGASFGLVSAYYKSVAANVAAAGAIRLGNTESLSWRNAGNSADLALAANASNILTYAGAALAQAASTGITLSAAGAISITAPVTIALGGTNSIAALNSNRFVVSSAGAIVEAAAVASTKVVGTDANGLPTSTGIGYGSTKFTGLAAGTTAGDSLRFEQMKVVQWISASTTTVTTVNTSTNTDTNVSATITPTSASNKVLVLVSAPWRITGTDLANGAQARVKRAGAVQATVANIIVQVSGQPQDQVLSVIYLDSPATTSATIYLINIISNNASNTITMPISNSFTASIFLVEVA